MSQLFIDEEEELDTRRGYKPSTTTIKEEDNSEDEEMSFDDRLRQDSINLPQNTFQSPPSIKEEEEEEEEEQKEEQEEEDDPIIESIPLVVNQMPNNKNQSLHLFQYPGRPKTRPLKNQQILSLIKPQSQYLELKLPLNPTKFFDATKIEEWGENINLQSISGVLDPLTSGNYAGKIIDDPILGRKIILIPINSSVQLRPTFKYIDDVDKENLQQQRKNMNIDEGEKPSVQILQTAAKHSTNNQDGYSHSLGDSLKSIKKFDEEEWKFLSFKSNSEDQQITNLKNQLINDADGIILESQTTYDEYIDHLYN
ncbi:hypothetical protein KGF54_005281 [Candida jiufengensis]|uniref:uncharacterized protein n=1 Tax=Candida jiufengensis TaxID=497108 RepID=UPI0022243636|nr:uncharacterized protein KGF54_005281 [Candida jiufengensis]KAI5950133.1 hypothetical protein KGF54_005281 [Candida jiufengensis]